MRWWSKQGNQYDKCPLTWENGGCEATIDPGQEGTLSMRSCHSPDELAVVFDDDHQMGVALLRVRRCGV